MYIFKSDEETEEKRFDFYAAYALFKMINRY